MAEETKKTETKVSTSKESDNNVNDTAIKNEQAALIGKLQSENATLKDAIGRQKKLSTLASRKKSGGIVGLQGLQGFKTR